MASSRSSLSQQPGAMGHSAEQQTWENKIEQAKVGKQ